jgi:hypothetical protein
VIQSDGSGVKQRGGSLPRGTVTLEEASELPGLRGRKKDETLRRDLEPARVGQWLPDGARHWRILFDAKSVQKIASALERGSANPYRVRKTAEPWVRVLSELPHGPRSGWATSDEIQLALHKHGIDGGYFTPRWLRERLLTIGVPSELRVVTTRRQHVFPLERAIGALREDRMVRERLDPELRQHRRWEESGRRQLARRKRGPKNEGGS